MDGYTEIEQPWNLRKADVLTMRMTGSFALWKEEARLVLLAKV
jgi:hypothetical protein